jgi:hypothetical protein
LNSSKRSLYIIINCYTSVAAHILSHVSRGALRSLRQGGGGGATPFWLNLAGKFHFFDFSTKEKTKFSEAGGRYAPRAPPFGTPLQVSKSEDTYERPVVFVTTSLSLSLPTSEHCHSDLQYNFPVVFEKTIIRTDSELADRRHSEYPVFLLYFIYELRSEHPVYFLMSGDRKQIIFTGDRKKEVRRKLSFPIEHIEIFYC